MENARGILIMFLLTTFLQNSTGQVLSDETLFQQNSCYGANADFSIVNANCSADKVIAVSRVQAGAKLNNSSCPIVLDENTTVDFENCCKITADDCVVNVSTTIWHTLCSGNESCLAAQAVNIPSNCTSMFRSNTSNMQLDYYCINITRIGSTCTQVNMTTTENALYLWNTGYSYGVNADTDCVCSIEVDSCDAHIDVTAMRIDLPDDNGTCIQNITFSDSYGNPEMVIDCSKQYDITFLFTSTTNYLSMNFISATNNTFGKYWIRFKATEAKSNLQVDCISAEQQMSCITTSTKTTSSTTTTTTTQNATTATTRTTTTATTRTTTATTRTTPTTKTPTPPTTAAPTVTTKKISTTTGKTEKGSQQNLEYIVLTALSIPVGIAIICLLRKRSRVKGHDNQVSPLKDELKSMTSEPEDHQSEEGSSSFTDETSDSSTTSRTTTTTATSRSSSPQTLVSVDQQTDVEPNPNIPTSTVENAIPTPPTIPTTTSKTSSTTTTTPSSTRSPSTRPIVSVLRSNQPSPPLCACSYCGQWGKHYHPIASSSRKYRKKKHFRCRYCGIYWEKITSLQLYSPCSFMSNQY